MHTYSRLVQCPGKNPGTNLSNNSGAGRLHRCWHYYHYNRSCLCVILFLSIILPPLVASVILNLICISFLLVYFSTFFLHNSRSSNTFTHWQLIIIMRINNYNLKCGIAWWCVSGWMSRQIMLIIIDGEQTTLSLQISNDVSYSRIRVASKHHTLHSTEIAILKFDDFKSAAYSTALTHTKENSYSYRERTNDRMDEKIVIILHCILWTW